MAEVELQKREPQKVGQARQQTEGHKRYESRDAAEQTGKGRLSGRSKYRTSMANRAGLSD